MGYDPHHRCSDECRHRCEHDGCDAIVRYHDEPFCYTHSPDEGSSMMGYDSRLRPLSVAGYVDQFDGYPLDTRGAIFY